MICRAVQSGASAPQTLRRPSVLETQATRSPFGAAISDVVSGKEKLKICSMLNGSDVGFAIDVSDTFAADAFLAGAGADDCAGAGFAGVCAFAANAVNIINEKQTTHTHE